MTDLNQDALHEDLFASATKKNQGVSSKAGAATTTSMMTTAPRTPAMVRLFAWVALLAVFFATGYIGANYLFKSFTDGKGPPAASGVVNSGMAVSQKTEPLGNASYKLFIPANGKFSERAIEIQRGLPEEDIQQLLTVYIDGLKETGVLETGVSVLNIFRSGDWLYADMSADFLKSLKKIGRNKSAEIIGGLVKTMQENFPPIKKVKFYIDGKESTDKNPVDLANPWELKG